MMFCNFVVHSNVFDSTKSGTIDVHNMWKARSADAWRKELVMLHVSMPETMHAFLNNNIASSKSFWNVLCMFFVIRDNWYLDSHDSVVYL